MISNYTLLRNSSNHRYRKLLPVFLAKLLFYLVHLCPSLPKHLLHLSSPLFSKILVQKLGVYILSAVLSYYFMRSIHISHLFKSLQKYLLLAISLVVLLFWQVFQYTAAASSSLYIVVIFGSIVRRHYSQYLHIMEKLFKVAAMLRSTRCSYYLHCITPRRTPYQ